MGNWSTFVDRFAGVALETWAVSFITLARVKKNAALVTVLTKGGKAVKDGAERSFAIAEVIEKLQVILPEELQES